MFASFNFAVPVDSEEMADALAEALERAVEDETGTSLIIDVDLEN